MFHCYILYSKIIDKYYIGHTNNLKKRLIEHNTHSKSKFTRQASDWVVAWSMKFEERNKARDAEMYIKRMKSKRFIEKLVSGEYSL